MARYLNCTLGSYPSACEAALARWVCSNHDRDVLERDGVWHGWAYEQRDCTLTIQRFKASTEDAVIQLIDQHFHIDRRPDVHTEEAGTGGGGEVNPAAPLSVLGDPPASLLHLQSMLLDTPLPPVNPRRGALPAELRKTAGRGQYHGVTYDKERYAARWKKHYLGYSVRDGQAVCEELYKAWLLFLSRLGLSHLIRIKLKTWQGAVERVLGLTTICVPISADEQAMSLPVDCLVPRSRKAMFRMQWEMVMTTLCTPETCVVVWEKRRRGAVRKSIYARQAAVAEEVHSRALLKERFPLWTDDWTPPPTLNGEELRQAAAVEAQALDLADLEHLVAREPDNPALGRELRLRKKGA